MLRRCDIYIIKNGRIVEHDYNFPIRRKRYDSRRILQRAEQAFKKGKKKREIRKIKR